MGMRTPVSIAVGARTPPVLMTPVAMIDGFHHQRLASLQINHPSDGEVFDYGNIGSLHVLHSHLSDFPLLRNALDGFRSMSCTLLLDLVVENYKLQLR
jgi:hypothetical protein